MIYVLSVSNWEEHNPRADVKTASWFRMSNDFFFDPEFYNSAPETRLVFLYILCAASKKMRMGDCKINTQMMADQTKIDEKKVIKAIEELILMGCVSKNSDNVISARSNPIGNFELSSATNERTDERTYDHEPEEQALAAPQREIASKWVDALNLELGTRFGVTKKVESQIKSLIKLKHSVDDAILVVKYFHTSWGSEPKMCKYLKPDTLFNGKFPDRLEEARNAGALAARADEAALDALIDSELGKAFGSF
jgi:uncharacterized phage protein (TIGR02220 family)